MKKIKILISIACCLLTVSLLILSSCEKMDNIQKKYAEKAETIYLGKVDSVQSFPGFGRVKLTWYINSDPRIDQTIIYWNRRQDSLVKDFNRTTPGVQKDSVIIDNLPEGTSLFEFRNVSNEGKTSLYSSASVTVWGVEYADGLHNRKIDSLDFDYSNSVYNLGLTPTSPNDDVVYAEITYTNGHGEKKTVRIDRDSNVVKLEDFPDGDSLRFRTAFFSPAGIDTLYNSYEVLSAPTAVISRGVKISLQGAMDNQYFSRGDSLYEWNSAGDLNVYVFNGDGSIAKARALPGILPRDAFKYFFFYDADEFIAVTAGNAVGLKRMEGDTLFTVTTSTGAETFGAGFNFMKFIAANGFFYTVTPGTGDLKTWFANDDATWGSPNGVLEGTGFTQYEPLTMGNERSALLGVDAEGNLWSLPVSANGSISNRSRIGIGWNRFKKIINVGTKMVCMEENGDFYVFDDFNITDKFWVVNR
jgi:hypothetical protein